MHKLIFPQTMGKLPSFHQIHNFFFFYNNPQTELIFTFSILLRYTSHFIQVCLSIFVFRFFVFLVCWCTNLIYLFKFEKIFSDKADYNFFSVAAEKYFFFGIRRRRSRRRRTRVCIENRSRQIFPFFVYSRYCTSFPRKRERRRMDIVKRKSIVDGIYDGDDLGRKAHALAFVPFPIKYGSIFAAT